MRHKQTIVVGNLGDNCQVNSEIQARFDALETKRKAMVERVRALPTEKQCLHPTPKDFSPVEVVMHMALAEQVDLDLMDKKPPASLAGKRAKPRFTFRWVVGSMRKAKRSPTMGSMVPKPDITLEEAETRWEEVRTRIRAHLDPLPGPDAPACKHPFFGLLSAADLLDLLDAHQHYHDVRFPNV